MMHGPINIRTFVFKSCIFDGIAYDLRVRCVLTGNSERGMVSDSWPEHKALCAAVFTVYRPVVNICSRCCSIYKILMYLHNRRTANSSPVRGHVVSVGK